ncbi:MAG TPA: hypothetical protein RMH99_16830 [Sandaracinaceae bacterium LLY-WYZ-13_1]|nr:hypothetical protein [Sandaracinaceae bacterium LLY-WYZ-13_1]
MDEANVSARGGVPPALDATPPRSTQRTPRRRSSSRAATARRELALTAVPGDERLWDEPCGPARRPRSVPSRRGRRGRALGILFGVLALLGACGGDERATETPQAAASTPTTDDEASDAPPEAHASDEAETPRPSGDTPSGDAPSDVWRPFADASPWNTPIEDDPPLRPDSDALVAGIAESAPPDQAGLWVAITPWSVPVYYVDDDTPRVDVHAQLSNEGPNATFQWPVPDGAEPAPAGDGHMVLVDREGLMSWDFFQGRRRPDGAWDCTLCATSPLNASGVRPPKGSPSPWYESHGSRACGYPLIAGLITVDELRAGRIEHALVMAYPGIRQRWFRAPASTGHPANPHISEDRGVPCGGRVQLDPSVDVDALELSPAGRTIARALQEYGAYVGDYAGTINLYADGSERAQRAFRGVLDQETMRGLDLRRLRVLDWGQLRPDG